MRTYNIKETYVDKDDLRPGILAAPELEISLTANSLKGYNMFQLVFVNDMILPKKHMVDW